MPFVPVVMINVIDILWKFVQTMVQVYLICINKTVLIQFISHKNIKMGIMRDFTPMTSKLKIKLSIVQVRILCVLIFGYMSKCPFEWFRTNRQTFIR